MFGFSADGGGNEGLTPCPDEFIEGLDKRDKMLVTIPPLIMHIGYLTQRIGDDLIFGEYGLNVLRYSILRHLSALGVGVSMKQLGDSMMKSAAGMTQNIDNLEEKELVRRVPDPKDRRVNLIEITDEGFALLTKVNEHYIKRVRSMMQNMDDDQLNQMYNMLFAFMETELKILDVPFDSATFLKTHGIVE
ncbi:MarR family transcriptional regulator [bacterium]|nr:MarR family transcriptional regulator [bacterium]